MSARTRAWFGLPVLLGLSTLLVASFSCNPVKAKPLATPAEAPAAPQPAAAPALPPAPQAGPFADQMAACEQRPFTAQKVSCQISTVAASVHDSLVSIKVRKRLRPQSGPSLLDQLFGGAPVFPQQPKRSAPKKKPTPDENDEEDDENDPLVHRGGGSGFIIDATKGLIVTNHHVAGNVDKIEVTLSNGAKFEAQLQGTDPYTDVAVIKLKKFDPAKTALKAVRIGSSDAAQQGEWVIAAGNPFGLNGSITVGVLSAKGRKDVTSSALGDSLQIDAPINPGNSGGPLLNLSGEVIGINNAIIGLAGNIGIGFAIPSNLANPVIAELVKSGKIARGWIGVGISNIPFKQVKRVLRRNRIPVPQATVVLGEITPRSPASRGGLQKNDIVIAIDGTPLPAEENDIPSALFFRRGILSHKPGDKVTVQVLRLKRSDEKSALTAEKLDIQVTVGTPPDQAGNDDFDFNDPDEGEE